MLAWIILAVLGPVAVYREWKIGGEIAAAWMMRRERGRQ